MSQDGSLGLARKRAVVSIVLNNNICSTEDQAQAFANGLVAKNGLSVPVPSQASRVPCSEQDRIDAHRVKREILPSVALDDILDKHIFMIIMFFLRATGTDTEIQRCLKLRDMELTLRHDENGDGSLTLTVCASSRKRMQKVKLETIIPSSKVIDPNSVLADFVPGRLILQAMRKITFHSHHLRRSRVLILAQFSTLLK